MSFFSLTSISYHEIFGILQLCERAVSNGFWALTEDYTKKILLVFNSVPRSIGIVGICLSHSLLLSLTASLVIHNLCSFLLLWLVLMEVKVSVKVQVFKQICWAPVSLRWTHWLPLLSTLYIVISRAPGKITHNATSLLSWRSENGHILFRVFISLFTLLNSSLFCSDILHVTPPWIPCDQEKHRRGNAYCPLQIEHEKKCRDL